MNIGTMRSSKSRSRNKSRNNPRSLGNVVNRVFDSSGPEGKVRGTPQQIIEKYLALARDAQLSGDRVAEQSFLQHAEHYTRMLGEAQREQALDDGGARSAARRRLAAGAYRIEAVRAAVDDLISHRGFQAPPTQASATSA